MTDRDMDSNVVHSQDEYATVPVTADGQVEQRVNLPARTRIVSGVMLCGGVGVTTSMDVSDVRNRIRLASILTGEHAAIVDQINTILEVEHVVCSRRTKTDDDTGEMYDLPYFVLIASDGSTYEGYGKVPLNSLQILVDTIGPPPWSPALPLSVVPWSGGTDRKSAKLQLAEKEYLLALDKVSKRGSNPSARDNGRRSR